MRRIRRAAIFFTALSLLILFVVSTWSHFSGGAGVGWATAIALLAVGYIPVAILGFRMQNPLLRAVAIPASVSLGLLNFGLVAAIACWILAGATWALKIPIQARSI